MNKLDKFKEVKNKPTQKKSTESNAKIITMPNSRVDVLSDMDIQSLFMGLVRLIKNNTIKEMDFAINEKYKEKVLEVSTLKQSLNLVKCELQEEKRINEKLQSEIKLLKQERLKKYNELMQNLTKKEKSVN